MALGPGPPWLHKPSPIAPARTATPHWSGAPLDLGQAMASLAALERVHGMNVSLELLCWQLSPRFLCGWDLERGFGRWSGSDEDMPVGPHGGVGSFMTRGRDGAGGLLLLTWLPRARSQCPLRPHQVPRDATTPCLDLPAPSTVSGRNAGVLP